jgi:malate dehydrogenase (oxaloacetate-decarboxylating)(NADP+)
MRSGPQEFIETVRRIAPTFGGINLEDIAAPHCFEIEQALIEELDIPVFHDDQHGTAIIIAAGLLNALELQGKRSKTRASSCLAPARPGIASVRLLIALGAHRNNFIVLDRKGVIHTGRKDLNPTSSASPSTPRRSLEDAMRRRRCLHRRVRAGSGDSPRCWRRWPTARSSSRCPTRCRRSGPRSRKVRDDMIMATGRSDYPNQVNNVLGFPFIFRGALDVRASRINEDMQIAAVHALKDLDPRTGAAVGARRLWARASRLRARLHPAEALRRACASMSPRPWRARRSRAVSPGPAGRSTTRFVTKL